MARILVTGSKGFLAKYLIDELLSRGHKVAGIDNGSKHGIKPRKFDKEVIFFKGHVEDSELMEKACNFVCPDVIIANAALIGGIKYFHDIPFKIIKENSEILHSTINAALNCDVKQIINISSSMVYESTSDVVREGMELNIPPPRSSYGFQKLESEYVMKAMKDQYGSIIDYTIVRPFNAVGVGEAIDPNNPGYSHVIPDFVYKIKNKDCLEIFGDGNQVRTFTHAKDIARGIADCVLNKEAYSEDFNFVSEEPIKMRDLGCRLWGMIRSDDFKPIFIEGFKHDVKSRQGFNQKARDVLGWEPKYSLEMILREAVKFYG